MLNINLVGKRNEILDKLIALREAYGCLGEMRCIEIENYLDKAIIRVLELK